MGLFKNNMYEPVGSVKAVRAYLDARGDLEVSYNPDLGVYADVHIAEWHNGREDGYVVCFRNSQNKWLNIAFFEHRNSDCICAISWVQNAGLNPPTIDTAQFGSAYKDKWDVTYSVECNEAGEMADWIYDQLEDHWQAGAT